MSFEKMEQTYGKVNDALSSAIYWYGQLFVGGSLSASGGHQYDW